MKGRRRGEDVASWPRVVRVVGVGCFPSVYTAHSLLLGGKGTIMNVRAPVAYILTRSCQCPRAPPQLHAHIRFKFNCIEEDLPRNVRIVVVGCLGTICTWLKAVGRGGIAADVILVA